MNDAARKKRKRRKRHPFEKLKRTFRFVYLKILRIEDPPERIARGAAIGVSMGILPTFGAGTLLSLALAFVFRANKAAAILGSFIMNPLTSPFFWALSVVVGSFVTGQNSSTIYARVRNESFIQGAGWAYLVFLAGNLIVTAVFTAASYYLVKTAVVRHRESKAEKMRRKEGG